ncbi:uncharacterized protein LOC111691507 [Anoplophora glabripennis]|uniref:uncharacterized protein LOC111691507 n=1 Tax=Anoplophora glabripennis TaxID=217634 RepID=UPI000C784D92|nr:uncharacterized protein LOC111691507 [Anoplophora glabripennis]
MGHDAHRLAIKAWRPRGQTIAPADTRRSLKVTETPEVARGRSARRLLVASAVVFSVCILLIELSRYCTATPKMRWHASLVVLLALGSVTVISGFRSALKFPENYIEDLPLEEANIGK